jgi:benzoyl-CoA reductase/2-hydroxyglutaryl-CoA dehydratase subunit BcrC/BadD/HgdB
VPATEVLLSSPWVPAEWVAAHGLKPRGLFVTLCPALGSLGAGVCAYAEAVRRAGEDRPDSVVVFTSTCDQLRRAFDAASDTACGRSFLLNVPVTCESAAARTLFRAELERLGRFLVRAGGQTPTSTELAAHMSRYDKGRRELRNAAGRCLAREFAGAVARFDWTGEVQLPGMSEAGTEAAPAVALLGGPSPGGPPTVQRVSSKAACPAAPAMECDLAGSVRMIELLERAGGRVALDATEAGERGLFPRLPRGDWSGQPLQALVGAYLDHGADVFQRPNTRLYTWLRERLESRRIRGIVLRAWVGCDLWRAEVQSLRETFRLPVLLLEGDENPGGDAREAGRVEAFVEMLR